MPIQIGYANWGAVRFGIPINGSNPIFDSDLRVSVDNNKGGENPFLVVHRKLAGSQLTQLQPVNPNSYVAFPGPSSFCRVNLAQASQPSWTASNLWARTNPTRPAVRLPVFWLEVREIPDMIRQAGRFLKHARNWRQYVRRGSESRDLATANLAFQFGWQPLLGDLYKLATFQDAVDKRRREIQSATARGGYRRRIGLGGLSTAISGSGFLNFGSYANFSMSWKGSSTSNSWAVLKWAPTPGGPGLPTKDDDLRRYLTGLHLSQQLANVWEALPWSWLIDYFSGIGDILEAGNHHVATPKSGSVMCTVTSTASHPPSGTSGVILSGGTLSQVWKYRTPVGGIGLGDIARIPTLGTGQLSILGSLALVKGRRSLGS